MIAEQHIDSWAVQFLTGLLKSLIIAFPGGGRALGHVYFSSKGVREKNSNLFPSYSVYRPAERHRAIEAGRQAECQVCGRGRGRGRGRPRHGP